MQFPRHYRNSVDFSSRIVLIVSHKSMIRYRPLFDVEMRRSTSPRYPVSHWLESTISLIRQVRIFLKCQFPTLKTFIFCDDLNFSLLDVFPNDKVAPLHISHYPHTFGTFSRVAVISAKNHKRQRRKRQSVTTKREKSQTPKFLTAILTLPNLT